MKNIAIFLLCAACLAMTACGKTVDNVQESLTEEVTTITEVTETEKVSVTSESETTVISTEQTELSSETTLSTEANTKSVSTSGYDVTVEELMPIIKTANYDMYIIKYGGDWFNLKDGHYVNYGGTDLYDMFNSMYEVFSEESGIAQDYISSLKCYSNGDELLISKGNMRNFTQVDEDIFNIDTTKYQTVDIDGGSGANPTFLSNEFEITNRAESSITLKNTAYYSEENDEPIQIFEYDMVFEDGTWKFNNFERWY